jgi:hypothetical protein
MIERTRIRIEYIIIINQFSIAILEEEINKKHLSICVVTIYGQENRT